MNEKERINCPVCGEIIPEGIHYCTRCGARLHVEAGKAAPPKPAASVKRRITAADARAAVVMSEILSPPLSKRKR